MTDQTCRNCGELVYLGDTLTAHAWQLDNTNYYTVLCPECNGTVDFKVPVTLEEDLSYLGD